MVKIELRKDGWFEAGKDSKDSFPMAYLIYQSKKTLKQNLTEISNRNLDRTPLEQALGEIGPLQHFKRTPYLRGDDIVIDTHGMPGTAYLGKIVEQA
jgi:hypothetical protein